MDNEDYYYVTLNTLSQIEAYDKLAIKNNNGTNILFVDKYSYFSSFFRYYYGYSRQNIIDYLKDFLSKFDKYVELLVKGNLEEYSARLIPVITKAKVGIENLKITYNSDSNIISELSLVNIKLTNLSDRLLQISALLNSFNLEEEKFSASNFDGTNT